MVRILVDLSAGVNQGAGIGRYARNVVPAMMRVWTDPQLTLWYAQEPNASAPFLNVAVAQFDSSRIRAKRSPLDRRRMDQLWFRARAPFPVELLTGRHDLIYSPDFTAPPSWRCPRVMTIHDLAFLIVPERAPRGLRDYLSAVVPRQVEGAGLMAAVSETTKLDLVERLRVAPERIRVVPNGVDRRFLDGTPLSADERASLGLPDSYLLTVGTIEPRKNHLSLLDAIALLPPDAPPLVIAGREGWSAREIVARARAMVKTGRVILLDYVPERLLPGLYAGAAAVAYVSWYEGFGLPVLEGLAAGCPVIASDVPAHREVARGEAHFVSPADPAEIAEALKRALGQTDPDAQARRRARAALYDWDTSGRALAALLQEAIAS